MIFPRFICLLRSWPWLTCKCVSAVYWTVFSQVTALVQLNHAVLCCVVGRAAVRAARGRHAAHCAGQEPRTQCCSPQRLHRPCALQHTATILHCLSQVRTHRSNTHTLHAALHWLTWSLQTYSSWCLTMFDWMNVQIIIGTWLTVQTNVMLIWAPLDVRVHLCFSFYTFHTGHWFT